jgi:hypothetical protein
LCIRSVQLRSTNCAAEKHRADHRLADVAEHGFAQARARPRPDRAKLDVIEQAQRLRHIRAALLAHEIGEPLGQFAFVGAGKGAVQHVRHDQPEDVIAEEFEALVTVAALARGFQRGNMREGRGEQGRIGELVPDACLERRGGRLGADLGALFLSRRRFAAGVRRGACFAG